MSLMKWTEENSVGVEEIDKQHQKLFSIISSLSDLMNQPKTRREVGIILSELKEYADNHFQTEERYFEKFGYEEKQHHTLLHKRYGEKIAQFVDVNMRDAEGNISLDILDFLEGWWLNHINVEDKKYMNCFKSHGLK